MLTVTLINLSFIFKGTIRCVFYILRSKDPQSFSKIMNIHTPRKNSRYLLKTFYVATFLYCQIYRVGQNNFPLRQIYARKNQIKFLLHSFINMWLHVINLEVQESMLVLGWTARRKEQKEREFTSNAGLHRCV